MRVGRSGGYWRHIQQTNSHAGSNLLYINGRSSSGSFLSILFSRIFILGTVRTDENQKYPTLRFGYPSTNRPQPDFSSSSFQEFSTSATDSLDSSTWSARSELNRRPSLSQYSNRYQQHAREGFAYWPTLGYQKPRCKF